MKKVIRDGKVAVLYSPRYGAGWYSWNTDHKELLFHPLLVEMVEQGKAKEITEEWILDKLGIDDVYCGGACDLRIGWVSEGNAFYIDEYDGSESIINSDKLYLIA